MKRIATLVGAITLLALLVGFVSGWYAGSRSRNGLIEQVATDRLAVVLFALKSIDHGNNDEAIVALQGSTNESLDWIIEYEHLNTDPNRAKFRCDLLSQLKTYRAQHGLFEGPKWEYLWKVPGMREAEKRRREFLEVGC